MTPGLDQVSKLKPGQGWVAADVQATSDVPPALAIDAGYKLSPNWAAYGDAWVQPTEGKFGADIGARYGNNLTLFAGGTGSTAGDWNLQAGVKLTF